jgi:hypothetical protein
MMQKSRVQEMFPFDRDNFLRDILSSYLLLNSLPIIILTFLMIVKIWAEFMSGEYWVYLLFYLLGTVLGLCGWLYLLYFLAKRFVDQYFFDITDQAVIVSFKEVGYERSLIIPFSKIKGMIVDRRWSGGSYYIKIRMRSFTVYPRFNPLVIGGFDEKTAFALKEYILEKSR